jgi:hypothetical protein
MKLTKGKIRKAYNKKRQTMKKYKKKKTVMKKHKTFRKRKPINLLKSTLRNYGKLGGQGKGEGDNHHEELLNEIKMLSQNLAQELENLQEKVKSLSSYLLLDKHNKSNKQSNKVHQRKIKQLNTK